MENISSLWNNTNYLLKIPYITSSYIIEYDLAKANINALLSEGIIDIELYNKLFNSEKMYREIYIGNMERKDKNVYKAKNEGITKARKMFFEENNIQDNEVLSIKNDAIFVLTNRPMKTVFGYYEFKMKNTYTFFMKLNSGIEIYYNYNQLNSVYDIDVKGIADSKLPLHQEHIINFMCEIFYNILYSPPENSLKIFTDFYYNYLNKKLDIGFYREFNPESKYKINYKTDAFYLEYLSNEELKYIDINTNLTLLRDIYFVLTDIYMKKVR